MNPTRQTGMWGSGVLRLAPLGINEHWWGRMRRAILRYGLDRALNAGLLEHSIRDARDGTCGTVTNHEHPRRIIVAGLTLSDDEFLWGEMGENEPMRELAVRLPLFKHENIRARLFRA